MNIVYIILGWLLGLLSPRIDELIRKENAKIVLRYLLAIALAFGAGFFVKSEVLVPSSVDEKWNHPTVGFNEEAGHDRILKFQETMETLKAKGANDAEELSKQLDVQLRIEDLIIKSREAENAKWLPFTPLFSGGLGAVLGFLAHFLVRDKT